MSESRAPCRLLAQQAASRVSTAGSHGEHGTPKPNTDRTQVATMQTVDKTSPTATTVLVTNSPGQEAQRRLATAVQCPQQDAFNTPRGLLAWVPVATPMSRAPQWPRIGSRKDPLRGMIGEGRVAKTRQLLRFLGTSASLPPLVNRRVTGSTLGAAKRIHLWGT